MQITQIHTNYLLENFGDKRYFIHQYIPTDKDYPPHSGTPQ